ncbi:hypothetical protein PoB_001984200 [Plakobranchus ocellatus]|uniref:Uncharacterized protein n=1 Tax=Plakobranchus ocellatus TaxID=259542 RepID=A0AAV3ZFM3_9GAST|nr:hypothetical protein PoB_001984200 [Plakobranchus ocellatus]
MKQQRESKELAGCFCSILSDRPGKTLHRTMPSKPVHITRILYLRDEAEVVRRTQGDGEFRNHQEQFSLCIPGRRLGREKKNRSNRICIFYWRLKS